MWYLEVRWKTAERPPNEEIQNRLRVAGCPAIFGVRTNGTFGDTRRIEPGKSIEFVVEQDRFIMTPIPNFNYELRETCRRLAYSVTNGYEAHIVATVETDSEARYDGSVHLD